MRSTERQTLLRITAFVLAVSALNLASALDSATASAPTSVSAPPNIIFIMADDLGYGDLHCYGQTQLQTPSIDTLAAQGMRFTQVYSGATVCAPSRCSLMTGMHTGNCTVRGNFGVSGRVPLNSGDETVAEVLEPAGYTSAVIGKWGLGEPDTSGIPNEQGFDYWYGYLNQHNAHDYYPTFLWEDDQQVPLSGQYSHDLFTSKALDFITNNAAGPFFLYLAYTIPHAAIQVPSDAPYSGESWPQVEKDFAAMVYRMDADIGNIMALLVQLGIDDNTIVFFTSDNGPHSEDGHSSTYFNSNGPLRGMKRALYDGGIRVPMIVRWPGQVPQGVESDQVWAFWDFLPTAAELAGLTPPANIDGISMRNALLGQPQQNHDYLYWESFEGFKQAARVDNWKGVRFGLGEPIELYDLSTDIGESNNVADAHPLVVSQLREAIDLNRTESTEWPLPVGCGAGQTVEPVTLTSYAGVAPECAALTLTLPGQKTYTDRTYELANIPPVYESGVLVQHANDDMDFTGSTFLTLSLADDADFDALVAVAYRADATALPGWLGDWNPTGDTVTGSGFPQGDVDFQLHVKMFGRGDTITLGGNRAGGGDAASSYMVLVAIVAGPIIFLSDAAIERTVYLGDDLTDDGFTVANGNDDTLSYTITDDADWLSVSPTGGASAGEANPIAVMYDVDELPFGEHQALISVSSGEAVNSPQTIAVRVTVETVGPDFNGDGDVDMQDFGHLQACYSGSGVVQPDPDCSDALLDNDADVDHDDFAIFQRCLSGPAVPADRTCDD